MRVARRRHDRRRGGSVIVGSMSRIKHPASSRFDSPIRDAQDRDMRPTFIGPIARILANLILCPAAFAQYSLGPDSQSHEGVPQGIVEAFTLTSKIFHGAVHKGWIYVPQQYDANTPACVMIFQDGNGYQNKTGAWRVPVVFDNLIN